MSDAVKSVVVASPIKEAHRKIGQEMLEAVTGKIVEAILHGELEVKSYKIEDNYTVQESISILLPDKSSVIVIVTHPSR